MEDFTESVLGRTGLSVGRLGMAASYGAPASAFEEAFEKGCNYFYLGSGRHRAGMKQAIVNLCRQGQRDKLVVAIHTYARSGLLTNYLFGKTLRSLGLDQADILILGWHNRQPSSKLIDRVLQLKEKGLYRFLGMSGHNRTLFPQMATSGQFDLFHIRYNAAHRGAEEDSFPGLMGHDRPGIVTYTATRWAQMLNPKKMPPGESVPLPSDCYRFVLSNPAVDVCLCGPKNVDQLRQALPALELGPMDKEDMARLHRIGDHVRKTTRKF
jgi:predicted aldo/keto reductase-like oxidoreductase